MEFFRQEYWRGLPFPSPGYLPNPGIEPGSPSLQADALPSAAAAAAKSLQSCPTLYDPTDGSPPGFPVPGTGNPVKVAGLWYFEIVVMKSTGKS